MPCTQQHYLIHSFFFQNHRWEEMIRLTLTIYDKNTEKSQSSPVNSSSPSAAYMRQWTAAWVIIPPGNGLAPVRCQAITWTIAGLSSIGLLGTHFSEIWIGILSFSFKKMQLKMSSAEMVAIWSRGSEPRTKRPQNDCPCWVLSSLLGRNDVRLTAFHISNDEKATW